MRHLHSIRRLLPGAAVILTAAALLLAIPWVATTQTISSRVQRIADGDGNPVTGADPLPVEIAAPAIIPVDTELETGDYNTTTPPIDLQALIGLVMPGAAGHVTIGPGAAGVPLPIEDDGGSLTIDSLQLPAALGAQAPVGSFSVVQDTTGLWTVSPALSSAAAAARLQLVDCDTGAGEIDRLGTAIVLPGNGATTLVGSGASGVPLPVWDDNASLTIDSPAIGATGAAAPADAIQIAGVDGAGNLLAATVTAAGMEVDLQSVGGAAFGLGAAAPGSSLPTIQDTTGYWTFHTGKVEDQLSASGDYGAAALSVRTDQLGGATGVAPLTDVDLDYSTLRSDTIGSLYVAPATAHGFGGAMGESIPGNPFVQGLEAKDFDGAVFPNVVANEQDVTRAAGSLWGVNYVMIVTEDGAAIGQLDLAQVGSVAFAQGTRAPASSISVTQATGEVQDVAGAVTTELGTEDYDTGAGTDMQAISGLIVPEAGGHLTVAGETLGIGSDINGEVALVVASATFGRKSATGATLPINAVRMASVADNLDQSDALAVAAGLFARIDAATLAPVAMQHGTTDYALSVVQAQPNGPSTNSALTVADQVVAPAENADIAANTNRANILIQSAGTTTCLVAIGTSTGGGVNGVVLKGGTADNDGLGGEITTESVEAIWIWDLGGAGTCKFRYIEEVW